MATLLAAFGLRPAIGYEGHAHGDEPAPRAEAHSNLFETVAVLGPDRRLWRGSGARVAAVVAGLQVEWRVPASFRKNCRIGCMACCRRVHASVRRRMLEEGRHGSIRELAAAEGVERASIGRGLNLTLLAPDLVQAVLDGRTAVAASRMRPDRSKPAA